jgi:hypothetical protein
MSVKCGLIPGRSKTLFSTPQDPDWSPHPSSAKVKNDWSCTSTLTYAFMACNETGLAFTVKKYNIKMCPTCS